MNMFSPFVFTLHTCKLLALVKSIVKLWLRFHFLYLESGTINFTIKEGIIIHQIIPTNLLMNLK